MGYYDPDIYNNSEEFGITVVGEVEWSEPSYSFDTTVVWRHDTDKTFYLASDSGCSCPSPFEYATSLDKAEGPLTAHQVAKYLQEKLGDEPLVEDGWDYELRDYKFAAPQVADLINTVVNL